MDIGVAKEIVHDFLYGGDGLAGKAGNFTGRAFLLGRKVFIIGLLVSVFFWLGMNFGLSCN